MPQDRAHLPFPPPAPAAAGGSDSDAGQRGGALAGGTYFLGRYRVVDEIGVGGMASVHLARMDGPGGFQKWVAIKRIHPHLVEDESFVNMFLDEARVAARISHPNVATVFELGKHEDTYWIAMEYLHGEPLREVMRRTEDLGQPMPPEIACRVIADAAEGLHSAHELLGRNGEKLGLVHRDVTPHNLFVTYDGSTKVVDFGIAKFSSRMANTRAGTLKGKLAYMSPEQVAGEPIDRRTDVFALGVVLWELTTGQRLFRMESDLDTLAKVQECNVPRPSTIVRGYPIDLEKIVMKALAKTKNERYRTAREFSRALQSLLMRRGLFIASDEVATYMSSVFGDRIQKREAHLRWAAEVTQTLDIDKLKGGLPPSPWKTEDGSILTYNSEVQQSQPATARPIPRPAAGKPAADEARQLAPTPQAGVLSARATLRLGAINVSAPAPAPMPRATSLSSPVDPSRSEDPPTLALPRGAPVEERPHAGASFEDDFDDAGDTIVSDSMPEMEELRRQPVPAPAAGLPPLGTTLTQAASPTAMAFSSGPRPLPPRLPTPAPLPAVVVPQSVGDPGDGDDTRTRPAGAEAHLAYPQPLLRSSLSNEYSPPVAYPQPMMQAHGPADMQRLFAPPSRNEQRTITAQSLKRRIPVWAVAVGSAAIGLMAFAFVILLLSRATSRPRAPGAKGAPRPSATAPAPVVVVVAPPMGPFASARIAFASTLTPSAPTSSAGAPAPAPAPAAPDPSAIPSANVASLPLAPSAPSAPRPSPHGAATAAAPAPPPPAAPTPSTAGAGSGTLKVICFPGCDQVIDNGSALGPSPIVRRNASVGSHKIKLVWSDGSKVVSTVVIADQTATVRENHP
ncbi:MAG TPA: protein kinase [Polyangiaceae bacterium]